MNIINIPVEAIKTDYCVRRSMGDTVSMMYSIRGSGLLQPLGVTSDYQLVYGRRRLEVCRKLEWKTVPVIVIDDDAKAYLYQRIENQQREAMTITEKAMFAQLIEKGLGIQSGRPRKLKDVMEENPDNFTNRGTPVKQKNKNNCTEFKEGSEICENFPKLNSPQRSSDIAAKESGLGNYKTCRQAQSVVSKGCNQLKQAMDDKKVSISAAAQLAKLPKEEQERLDYDNPKALKQKAKVLRMKKPEEPTEPDYNPEVLALSEQIDPWPDEWVFQLMALLDKRIKRKGLTVIDGGKD